MPFLGKRKDTGRWKEAEACVTDAPWPSLSVRLTGLDLEWERAGVTL